MSFGFSPGDIALFLGFATKVIKALKEAGGSKSEYWLAQQQCQRFLMIMDDIQRLDLSNVSESFRNQIEEYSTHTREFVKDFKEAIVKYEKSMGKSSHRGFMTSAPRKVQWAFSAADDLDKFRQSLSAQVNLVHLTISNAILSIVARSNEPQQFLLEPARSSALTKAIYPDRHNQGYLNWNYNMASLDMLERVDNIADLVYERLLTKRSGLLLADHGKVHTLPDNVSSSTLDTISHRHTLPSTGHSDEVSVRNKQHVRSAHEQTHSAHQETLESEINEYLRSLGLEELSEQEAAQVNQISSQRFLLNGPEEPSEPLPQSTENNRDQPQPSGSDGQKGQTSKSRHRLPPFIRHRMPSFEFPMDALNGISLAIRITQLMDSAAKTSFDLMRTRSSIKEFAMLSRRIRQFSDILETARSVICTSMSAEQQRLGLDIIQQSQAAINEVDDMFDYVFSGGLWLKCITMVGLMMILLWKKKRVLLLMDEIESLKSTFSILLQTHQIQISERSFAEIQYARQLQMATPETLEIQRIISART